MNFDFDTVVDRQGLGSFKHISCPQHIQHNGLLSYNGAEMEFKTAPSIMAAIHARAEASLPSYTLCDQPYREAVKWWMSTQRHFALDDDWIIPTHGTIFSLATAIRMATAPGDSIIIQPPVYNRYEQAASRLGRKTLKNNLTYQDGGYHMDLQGLEALMARPDAKILALCNPHNPTGNVWDVDTLTQIAAMANRYGVLVFSDEIFAEVTYDVHCPSYLDVPGAAEHAIVATSLGKTFSFTGTNHANILIRDADLMTRFRTQRNADHYGSIDPWTYSAIIGAYSPQGAAWKDAAVQYIEGNIRLIKDYIERNLPVVSITPCQGTYVLWIDWSGLGMDENRLLQFLEREALLHLSPGSEYYADRPCLTRMCVAVPRQELSRSLSQLDRAAAAQKLTAD